MNYIKMFFRDCESQTWGEPTAKEMIAICVTSFVFFSILFGTC